MNKKGINEKALDVKNADLEAAMKAFSADNSKENLAKMMEKIRPARFLVPAEFPKDMDKQTALKLAQGKPLKPGEGPRMLPMIVQNQKGERFAPVFTSREQLPKGRNYQAILNVDFGEVIRVASDPAAKLSGVILNPETDRMILHPQFIETMKKFMQGQPPQKGIKMTREQFEAFARGNVERNLIPRRVFTEKASFMEKLDEQREQLILELYRQPYGDKIPFPYEEKDFDVMVLNIDERTCVASVGLPEKNLVPQAAVSLYIVWNPQTDDIHYYMIEKGQQGQENVLCHITPEGKHEELQTAPAAGNELTAVLDLLREEE